ncbi:MAG: hypothetical protein FJZ16_06465 [Candidatus Omnitrophica bacterium]|nr:hypothetical protein [Candidatus Omnitrophota bacterium]
MLQSIIIPVSNISPQDKIDMLSLMSDYYENVSEEQFLTDLEKKDCVIVIKEEGFLYGFSTQVLLRRTIEGQNIRILFSGDTVIDKKHRNSFVLPLAWGKMMLSILKDQSDIPLYWLLTTKGYKTYRYLPVFFNDYFPSPTRKLTDFEANILSHVGKELFNGKFDGNHWIIHAKDKDQRLRPGVADITEAKRNKEEIAYFEKMNPNHPSGDELVCLAQFKEQNLKPFILKRLLNS